MHFMQQHTYIHSILLSYQAKSPTIIHKTNDLENKMCGSFQSSGASTYLSSGVPTTPLFSSSSQMSNSDFPFCWLEAEFTRKLLCPPLFFASFIFLARLTKASTLAHFPSMQLASFLHSLLDRQPTGTQVRYFFCVRAISTKTHWGKNPFFLSENSLTLKTRKM